ncbi:MAG TPA: MATE family efflux transporter [Flavobacterium sp.]|nr:MATE family efflux transporter [Flavobacterium sp.]
MSETHKELLEGPVLKSLLRLTTPIIIANALQAAYQLVDAFWVGRLGSYAVAAVSVSTPVIFFTMSLGLGFSLAGSILIAQYFGARNQKMVNHIAAQTLLLVVVISVVLGAVGWVLSPYFIELLDVDPKVSSSALDFLQMSFIGLVFNFTFFVFQSMMRSVGNANIPVYIVFGTVVLNFALDPLLIFGWGSFDGLGVMGAAIATLITQSLACVIGFVLLFRGRHGIHVKAADFKPDAKHIQRAFLIGFPASIEQSMRALGIMMLTFLIAAYGTTSVAIYGAASNILQVVMILALGLSMAVSTLAGQNIGAGNIERAAKVAKLGSSVGFGALIVLGLIVYFTAEILVAFFVPNDPAVINGGAGFLRIMCLSWGFIGLQMSLAGVLRASGNMISAMVLTLVSQWVLQFPLAYILSHKTGLGVDGIWYAFPVTNIIIALITMAVFAKGDWKKKRLTDDDSRMTTEIAQELSVEEAMRP